MHSEDGSTVGRFSRRFGMDVHTTVTDQLAGAGQCLHCTHAPAGQIEWVEFCRLIGEHYSINVDVGLLKFESEARPDHSSPSLPVNTEAQLR